MGHETGAEPKLNVVKPFTARVFDVLIGDAPARIVVRENARHELDPAEKASQISFRLDDLQMGAKRFELERGKLEVVHESKLENRLQTQVAIEMPMQIDDRKRGLTPRYRLRWEGTRTRGFDPRTHYRCARPGARTCARAPRLLGTRPALWCRDATIRRT